MFKTMRAAAGKLEYGGRIRQRRLMQAQRQQFVQNTSSYHGSSFEFLTSVK
jgi:hypothetical protein